MRTADLDFDLPEELIALHPPRQRSASRLMAVACRSGGLGHHEFHALPQLLQPGDLLVFNDTRVVPARIVARKTTGGRVDGLWLADAGAGRARCMLSGGRLRPGVELVLEGGPRLRLEEKLAPGRWLVADLDGIGWPRVLAAGGATPLPPYIRSRRAAAGEAEDSADDRRRYQTRWARADGAVAAPTAGLHFDAGVEEALRARGVESAYLTLHVGPGTFEPVKAEVLEEHSMEAERFRVPAATLEAVAAARARGGRVVAVGTTVCRVLEHLARAGSPAELATAGEQQGATRLFITPGFRFGWTDALLSNFHLPRSTLLALVAALAGHLGAADGLELVKRAYAEAVARRYRFYSYGDATLWSS